MQVFFLAALLLSLGCTNRVVLGEREGDLDAAGNLDAATPVDARVPDAMIDAEPESEPDAGLCTCCCEKGGGTCPKLCECEETSDCPDSYQCLPPEGGGGGGGNVCRLVE